MFANWKSRHSNKRKAPFYLNGTIVLTNIIYMETFFFSQSLTNFNYFIILKNRLKSFHSKGSKRVILKCSHGVSAISSPQEENHAKFHSSENTAMKCWQIRALSETGTQLQVLSLAKAFFLLLFPTFRSFFWIALVN